MYAIYNHYIQRVTCDIAKLIKKKFGLKIMSTTLRILAETRNDSGILFCTTRLVVGKGASFS